MRSVHVYIAYVEWNIWFRFFSVYQADDDDDDQINVPRQKKKSNGELGSVYEKDQ